MKKKEKGEEVGTRELAKEVFDGAGRGDRSLEPMVPFRQRNIRPLPPIVCLDRNVAKRLFFG